MMRMEKEKAKDKKWKKYFSVLIYEYVFKYGIKVLIKLFNSLLPSLNKNLEAYSIYSK